MVDPATVDETADLGAPSTAGVATGDAGFLRMVNDLEARQHALHRQAAGRRAARLVLITAAAIFAGVSWQLSFGDSDRFRANVAVGMLLLAAALAPQLSVRADELASRAERLGAAATLIRSHLWRFALRVEPYTLAPDQRNVALLMARRDEIMGTLAPQVVHPPGRPRADLADLWSRPLAERTATYVRDRLVPHQQAAARAAARWDRRARAWALVAAAAQVGGFLVGIFMLTGVVQVDGLGIASAVAAGAIAWSATQRHAQVQEAAQAVASAAGQAVNHISVLDNDNVLPEVVRAVEDRLSVDAESVLQAALSPSRTPLMPSVPSTRTLEPSEFFGAIERLAAEIKADKVEPDLVIAVNPGGSIVGGILYFLTRGFAFLAISFRGSIPDADWLPALRRIGEMRGRSYGCLSILVVDASLKSGESLLRAMAMVRDVLQRAGWTEVASVREGQDIDRPYTIRSAVLAYKPPADGPQMTPDYYIFDDVDEFPYGSV